MTGVVDFFTALAGILDLNQKSLLVKLPGLNFYINLYPKLTNEITLSHFKKVFGVVLSTAS